MMILTGRTIMSGLRPPYPCGGEFPNRFLFALKLCWFPLLTFGARKIREELDALQVLGVSALQVLGVSAKSRAAATWTSSGCSRIHRTALQPVQGGW